MVQTYLSSAIDDHSRMILASAFYDNQEETIVEDTFHRYENATAIAYALKAFQAFLE